MIVAVPTNTPGGMEAKRSDHFGHCDIFTLIDISENGDIQGVTTIENGGHEAGGCMVPVQLLKEAGAGAIVVGGLGARPMQGFHEAGIKVFFADPVTVPTAQEAAQRFLAHPLPEMRADQVCKGSGNCHH